MAKLILAADRIVLARAMIQKARDLPVPVDVANIILHTSLKSRTICGRRVIWSSLFINTSATAEIKGEAKKILTEADQANKEILH